MLGHIGVNVRDLVQAKAYYDGLMPLLGFEAYITATDQFAYRPALALWRGPHVLRPVTRP